MWCPKCKNEYVPGITKCADCGVDLVAELSPEISPDFIAESDDMELNSGFSEESPIEEGSASDFDALTSEDDAEDSTTLAPAFVSKAVKAEDMKSTAYTFTFISILGLLLLILFDFNVFPISVYLYMKIIINVVLGVMLLIFLGVGINAFSQLKKLKNDSLAEQNLETELHDWFFDTYDAEKIDKMLQTPDTDALEQRYFIRYEKMQVLITEQYPDLDAPFLDHMIETLYSEIFKE